MEHSNIIHGRRSSLNHFFLRSFHDLSLFQTKTTSEKRKWWLHGSQSPKHFLPIRASQLTFQEKKCKGGPLCLPHKLKLNLQDPSKDARCPEKVKKKIKKNDDLQVLCSRYVSVNATQVLFLLQILAHHSSHVGLLFSTESEKGWLMIYQTHICLHMHQVRSLA